MFTTDRGGGSWVNRMVCTAQLYDRFTGGLSLRGGLVTGTTLGRRICQSIRPLESLVFFSAGYSQVDIALIGAPWWVGNTGDELK